MPQPNSGISKKDEAAQYLRLALPLMSKYSIPVTPENYSVWYDYVSGANEPLRVALDELMSNDKPLSEELTTDLHERYVTDVARKKLDKTRNALRVLLDEIGGSIASADGEVSRYQASLEDHSSSLDESASASVLKNVIDRLADETRAVRDTGVRLHDRLEESRKEAEALRKELEEARLEATTDALTGLANRKAFLRGLAQMQSNAASDGTDLCVLLVDIDNFKTVNDRYGHLLGDKVLRFIGSIMKDSVKGKDLVSRHGGDEFAILLPDTPFRGALAVGEVIRAGIEGGRLVRSDTKQAIGTLTVSIGVALSRSGESTDDLIGRADEALYRSKEAGRNRVTGEGELLAVAS